MGVGLLTAPWRHLRGGDSRHTVLTVWLLGDKNPTTVSTATIGALLPLVKGTTAGGAEEMG